MPNSLMQQGYWGRTKQMRKQLRERVNSMLGNPPTPFSRPPCRSPFPLQHVLPVRRGSGQFQFYHMIQQSDGIVRGLGMDIQENPNSFEHEHQDPFSNPPTIFKSGEPMCLIWKIFCGIPLLVVLPLETNTIKQQVAPALLQHQGVAAQPSLPPVATACAL